MMAEYEGTFLEKESKSICLRNHWKEFRAIKFCWRFKKTLEKREPKNRGKVHVYQPSFIAVPKCAWGKLKAFSFLLRLKALN